MDSCDCAAQRLCYVPEKDLPRSNAIRPKIEKYLKAIDLAVARYWVELEKVEEIDISLKKPLARLIFHSVHMHALLFKDILLHYGEIIESQQVLKATARLIQYVENTWKTMGGSLPGHSTISTPEELLVALLIGHTYEETQTRVEHIGKAGIARMFSICLGESGHAEAASTKAEWPQQSFLQAWTMKQRQSQVDQEGSTKIKTLVDTMTQKIRSTMDKERNTEGEALLALAMKEPLQPMEGHWAQAFDGHTLKKRDRCWRCRSTLGYQWITKEEDPQEANPMKVKDFEKAKVGEGEVEVIGRCAEYVLWWRCSKAKQ
ncbi:MAG: hypothetical protein M1816_004609 [Peltula sp. TS41687]|nr:MAG: hypothetical protein M1816_004609 [Peltula sp. TS41687]